MCIFWCSQENTTDNQICALCGRSVDGLLHVCVCVFTGHVHHAAVAVLHQIARLAVDAAGGDTVCAEEFRVHGRWLAVAPRRRKIRQLHDRKKEMAIVIYCFSLRCIPYKYNYVKFNHITQQLYIGSKSNIAPHVKCVRETQSTLLPMLPCC